MQTQEIWQRDTAGLPLGSGWGPVSRSLRSAAVLGPTWPLLLLPVPRQTGMAMCTWSQPCLSQQRSSLAEAGNGQECFPESWLGWGEWALGVQAGGPGSDPPVLSTSEIKSSSSSISKPVDLFIYYRVYACILPLSI